MHSPLPVVALLPARFIFQPTSTRQLVWSADAARPSRLAARCVSAMSPRAADCRRQARPYSRACCRERRGASQLPEWRSSAQRRRRWLDFMLANGKRGRRAGLQRARRCSAARRPRPRHGSASSALPLRMLLEPMKRATNSSAGGRRRPPAIRPARSCRWFITRDEVGGGHRLGLVVRDVDGRVAVFVVQAAHLEAHLLAQVGVEVGERLVEQQRLGFDDQRARERHALLLPAGELARIALAPARRACVMPRMPFTFAAIAALSILRSVSP